MTGQRQLLIEELRRRNFAESTIRSYLHAVEPLQPLFPSPARSAWSEHTRQYQAALFTKLKFSPASTPGYRRNATRPAAG